LVLEGLEVLLILILIPDALGELPLRWACCSPLGF